MDPRHIEAIVFSVKAAISAVLAYLCCEAVGIPVPGWAAISAVLVIQPTVHSSFKISMIRVVANILGAFGGAALLVSFNHLLPALTVGIMTTGLVCYLLKADEALRPAFAAVVIVITTSDPRIWHSSLERVMAVVIGCICAMGIGFLFDKLADAHKILFDKDKDDDEHPKQTE